MMKKIYHFIIISILILSSLSFHSCEMVAPDTPDCILEKIDELKGSSTEEYQAQVLEYTYNGYLVYYIPPTGPNEYGEVYDIYCNLICQPDGGPSGNGDGNCTNFLNDAIFKRLIWQD